MNIVRNNADIRLRLEGQRGNEKQATAVNRNGALFMDGSIVSRFPAAGDDKSGAELRG
jgi:hypothetical protein